MSMWSLSSDFRIPRDLDVPRSEPKQHTNLDSREERGRGRNKRRVKHDEPDEGLEVDTFEHSEPPEA
jgi:hypothetical protein